MPVPFDIPFYLAFSIAFLIVPVFLFYNRFFDYPIVALAIIFIIFSILPFIWISFHDRIQYNALLHILQTLTLGEVYEAIPSSFKYIFVIYVVCAMISFLYAIYSDGKTGLYKYRTNANQFQTIYYDEYAAIKGNMNVHHNFWESIIFPYTLFSNVMPFIIIWLNPMYK